MIFMENIGEWSVPAEISGPAGIDDGIHAGIEPTEPRDDGEDAIRIVNALETESRQQVGDEERQPTGDEDAHDDAQRLGRLPLFGDLRQFATQRKVHFGDGHRPAGVHGRPERRRRWRRGRIQRRGHHLRRRAGLVVRH